MKIIARGLGVVLALSQGMARQALTKRPIIVRNGALVNNRTRV